MKDYFIFGDCHSNHQAVIGLLQQEGLLDGARNRLYPSVDVVSIGDLANCVLTSRDDDLKCLRMVGPIVDKLILGNHEAPYFNLPSFTGFFPFPEVKEFLRELLHDGLVVPCLAVGGVFISHAGVAAGLGKDFPTAERASQAVTDAFMYNPRNPLLHAIGHSRGGWDAYGGVLWSDWSEAKTQNFRQVCGHTVGKSIRYYTHGRTASLGEAMTIYLDEDSDNNYHQTYNIDLGCNLNRGHTSDRLAGVWIRGGELEFVIYDETGQNTA